MIVAAYHQIPYFHYFVHRFRCIFRHSYSRSNIRQVIFSLASCKIPLHLPTTRTPQSMLIPPGCRSWLDCLSLCDVNFTSQKEDSPVIINTIASPQEVVSPKLALALLDIKQPIFPRFSYLSSVLPCLGRESLCRSLLNGTIRHNRFDWQSQTQRPWPHDAVCSRRRRLMQTANVPPLMHVLRLPFQRTATYLHHCMNGGICDESEAMYKWWKYKIR
ncbi:hypothetical protein BKA82DRAFT_2655134 [Pisolithus tinctorius]|nr:hypothetical protein BKA82DRAFT_2655134 [Pisolithus tinctorius]